MTCNLSCSFNEYTYATMANTLKDDNSDILNKSIHNQNSVMNASHNLHSSISEVSFGTPS